MSKKTAALNIRCLCEAAILVALAQALSYVKLMQLPNGGSLTPAMFPMLLFAIRWGVKPGLLAGFAFGLLQLIFDVAYAWGWQSMLLDSCGLCLSVCRPLYQRDHHLQDYRANRAVGYDFHQPILLFPGL